MTWGRHSVGNQVRVVPFLFFVKRSGLPRFRRRQGLRLFEHFGFNVFRPRGSSFLRTAAAGRAFIILQPGPAGAAQGVTDGEGNPSALMRDVRFVAIGDRMLVIDQG